MEEICDGLGPVLRLVGIVIKGIQIVVPLLLIIWGMLDFAKATTEKDEKKMADARKTFISRAVAALCVFLVATLVKWLMILIGNNNYEECLDCIRQPFSSGCKESLDL